MSQCAENQSNTGASQCPVNLLEITGFIAMRPGFKFNEATKSELLDSIKVEATWQGLINNAKSSRAYPFQGIGTAEPTTPDPRTEEMGYGSVIDTGETAPSQLFYFKPSQYDMISNAKLRSFNNGDWDVFELHGQTNGIAFKIVEEADGSWSAYPFPTDRFRVLQKVQPDGSVSAKSRITYQYENATDVEEYYYYVIVPFSVNKLRGLVDVEVSLVGTPTATEMVLQVAGGIEGLEDNGNWFLNDSTGTPLTITGDATESATVPGEYTFVTVGNATGATAGFNVQPTATDKGFEGSNSVTMPTIA